MIGQSLQAHQRPRRRCCKTIYCGIDNGLKRTLVWINETSEIGGNLVMPTRSTGKKDILDPRGPQLAIQTYSPSEVDDQWPVAAVCRLLSENREELSDIFEMAIFNNQTADEG